MVSIILPAYNAEFTLARAISSVLAQTAQDWELLVVDDGSNDKTYRIAQSYALHDQRIRVFREPNSGVSAARNLGLREAKGEYVAFLDADDMLAQGFLAANKASDLTICGFEMPATGFKFLPSACGRDEIAQVPYYLDTCWGKFFRKEIIDASALRFDTNLRLTEDTVFCYEYLSACADAACVPEPLYIYNGEWGVARGKAMLSREEFEHMLQRNARAMRGLQTKADLRGRAFHLRHLKGLFSDFDFDEIFEMYSQAFGYECGKEEFLADYRLSPLNQVIERLASIDEAELVQYRRFFTVSPFRFFAKAVAKAPRRAVFYLVLMTCPLWAIKLMTQ